MTMLKKKKICFFAKVKSLKYLKLRQWYKNDIEILRKLGYKVIIATKFNDIPFNCDLYFSWFTTSSILPLIVAKIIKKPIIIIAGGSEVVGDSFGYFSKPWYTKIIIKINLKYADTVLAVSKNILKEIERFEIKNAILLYNGINIEKFKPTNSKRDIILSCTRLDSNTYEGKKIALLLKSIPYVIKEFPKQKFVIIGEKGDAYIKVKLLIKKLNISNNIILLGSVSNDIIKQYFNQAQICIQPTRYEAFGFAIAEAMSCGIPVITTNVGAVSEIVGNCGFYVNDDPRILAERIIYLLKNKIVREKIGREARERIKNYFSLEKRKNGLKKILTKINL